MVKILLSFLFLAQFVLATEHFFNYSDITSPGEITKFPANFGSFRHGMSFSGSLNALSRLSYKPNMSEYKTDRTPVAIEPRVLSSGLGQSWGGWGFVITNDVEKIKLQSDALESTEDLRSIEVHLGSGLKLSKMWNIGWSLTLNNDQRLKTDVITDLNNTDKPLTYIESQKEAYSTQIGFGFLMETESFIVGTHLKTPKVLLTQNGKLKSRYYSVSQNKVIRDDNDQSYGLTSNFELDFGVKFGTKGFTYSIADTYFFEGTHALKAGFEYIGSWGRVSTGFSRHQRVEGSEFQWSVGFCRSEKEFDWGVGPFYRTFQDRAVDRNEVGVLYSSQINY